MTDSTNYFDPETLARIKPLGLRARTLIEGFVAGLHRSPLKGHSIEFAEHREYAMGDDLRQVDWKVYARTDRFFLKQYEDETNLVCYLLTDQSASMDFRGEDSSLTKLQYAELITCSLCYLVVEQQDSAGLVTFGDSIHRWIPPVSSHGHLDDIIAALEERKPSSDTSLKTVLDEVVRRVSRPALIMIVSDFLDDLEETLTAIKLLRFAGHDVMLLHVLDRAETDFPYDRMTRFDGLETASPLLTDPSLIAGAYRRAMEEFQVKLQSACQQLEADYFLFHTDESLAQTLPRVLATRMTRSR